MTNKKTFFLLLALIMLSTQAIALLTFPGTHSNALSLDGTNIIEDYRVNTALLIKGDITTINQTAEDYYSILFDQNYTAADIYKERIIFNFLIDTNYRNESYPNPLVINKPNNVTWMRDFLVPYQYNRWADQSKTIVVDWDNTDILQKSVKYFGGYALECVGNNLDQCQIINSFYTGVAWELFYTYKFNKDQVCSSDVKRFMADKNSYFDNATAVRENECAVWDKNWYRNELVNMPSYSFADTYHAYPKGINFGEPAVLVTNCQAECLYFPDEAGLIIPSKKKNFVYMMEGATWSNCEQNDYQCMSQNNVYISGYLYSGSSGTSQAQGTIDCGDFPKYYKNVKLNRSSYEMLIFNTCDLEINPSYRGKSVLDSTTTFSSLFSGSGYKELESAGKKLRLNMIYRVYVQPNIAGYPHPGRIITVTDSVLSKYGTGQGLGNGGYSVVTNITGTNQSINGSTQGAGQGLSTVQLAGMANTNFELENIQKKVAFFDFMLIIVDFFVSIMVVITYLLEIAVIVFVLFVAVPGVFTRTIKLFKELMVIKK